MRCKNCGETMEGDGYVDPIHCPNANEDNYQFNEPDANPVYCGEQPKQQDKLKCQK